MGDWTPDEVAQAVDGCTSYCRANFWIVPAKVAVTWKLPQGELTLEQKYQVLNGSLKTANGTHQISDGKMTGDQITFKVNGQQYNGKVEGNTMSGDLVTAQWKATKG
jgi:hypothetical protein